MGLWSTRALLATGVFECLGSLGQGFDIEAFNACATRFRGRGLRKQKPYLKTTLYTLILNALPPSTRNLNDSITGSLSLPRPRPRFQRTRIPPNRIYTGSMLVGGGPSTSLYVLPLIEVHPSPKPKPKSR